ncbi:MAG: hypothetical protein B7Y41_01850 [Hydrogenophilales bacterium 28-61-23]|nr:MAG: hypothetical protein B7Y41_01850 [Hydrogenophilales bacterium 28-61-23]
MACAHEKPAERRIKLLLRDRFDMALGLLKPLLQNPEARNGTSLYRAMSKLQVACPDLNGHEIEALVTSVMQALQNRHPRG